MTVDDMQLKIVVKEAMWELVQEKREEFPDLFSEIFEDMVLSRAIRAGEATDLVSRDDVFALLDACGCRSVWRQ
jgi:hypothetical protein